MQKSIRKFITKQFGNPTGFWEIYRMAKRNVYDAKRTVPMLDIQPHHRILEIGFGPG